MPASWVDWNRRMQAKGVTGGSALIAWPDLMRFKRTFTGPVPASSEHGYADAGIAAFHGRVHFLDQARLQIGSDTLVGRHVVIAAGARPATLGIPGEALLTTSEQFLEPDNLPPRIAFVGGGYISLEFAHIAVRSGAQVHILHRGPRPLVGFDPDLVDHLAKATHAPGVDIRLNTTVTGIEQQGSGLVVWTAGQDGRQSVEVDMVVHGAGRVADIDDMELGKAGVQWSNRGGGWL